MFQILLVGCLFDLIRSSHLNHSQINYLLDDDSSSESELECGQLVIIKDFNYSLNRNKFIDCIGVIMNINNSYNKPQYDVKLFITNFDFNTLNIESGWKDIKMTSSNCLPFSTLKNKFPRDYQKKQLIKLHYLTLNFQDDEFLATLIGGAIVRSLGSEKLKEITLMLQLAVKEKNLRKHQRVIHSFECIIQKYGVRYSKNIVSLSRKNIIKTGDIAVIKQLKSQNNSDLNEKVKIMTNSFGIFESNQPRRNNRNQTEYLIQSVFNENIFLWIRPKWIKEIISKIYIHDISNCSVQYFSELYHKVLLDDSSNNLLYFPPLTFDKDAFKSVIIRNLYSPHSSQILHSESMAKMLYLQKIDLNSIKKETIINFLNKIHLFFDLFSFCELMGGVNKTLAAHSKTGSKFVDTIIDVHHANMELLCGMTRFDDKSMNKLKIVINKNIQNKFGKLLDFKDKKDGKENKKLWVEFIKYALIYIERYKSFVIQRRKYLKSCKSYKEMLISDIIGTYLDRESGYEHLHVFTHDIHLLDNLDIILGTIIHKEFNINDIQKSSVLVKKIINRKYYN